MKNLNLFPFFVHLQQKEVKNVNRQLQEVKINMKLAVITVNDR